MEDKVLNEQAELRGKLASIQKLLKVGKTRYNKFGGYYSRSREDIIEAVKPLCFERGLLLSFDEVFKPLDNGWVYIVASATVTDIETGKSITAYGLAREPESKPKMDSSQTTGSASSYAGKRALGNLFAIDDTQDADQVQQVTPNEPFIGQCTACGNQFKFDSQVQMENSACTCGNNQFQVV